jgi:zinc transport system substrate-binding protein
MFCYHHRKTLVCVQRDRILSWVAVLLSAALLAGTTACAGPAASPGRLRVYASFYPMYDFTAKVAGDRAVVSCLVPPGGEPHIWEPTAADITGLERADVFIYNGAGMETWVGDVLGTLSNPDLLVVETAAGLPLLKGGDIHDGGSGAIDPHVWLNPRNAKKQLEAIRNALSKADPAGAAVYDANYSRFAAEFDALDREYRAALAPYANREIVVAHQAFGYLCAEYGLVQVPVEGLTPESEPDPARIAEVIRIAREHEIRVIFFEAAASPKVAETIARAIGARVDVLSPVAGLDKARIAAGEDYFSVMRDNLRALVNALK